MEWSRKRSIAFFLFCLALLTLFLYLHRFGPIPTVQTLPAEGNLIAFYAVTFPSPFTRERGLFLVDMDTRKIMRWTSTSSGIGGGRITWLEHSQQLFFVGILGEKSGIYTISVDGISKELPIFTQGEAGSLSPAFSRDERYLAFSRNGNIYIYDLQTTEIHQITHDDAHNVQPRWSPNDQALVFSSAATERAWLYTINRVDLDGSNRISLTERLEGSSSSARWSPDGTMIAFGVTSSRDVPRSLWIMDQDGSNARQIVPPHRSGERTRGVGAFAWSPDSRQIAFASGRDGFCYITVGYAFECTESIYLINIDGTGLKRLTYRWQIGTSLTWIR
jgi:Tol biopolymer transport system component